MNSGGCEMGLVAYPWILFKHNLIHDPFEKLIYDKPRLLSKIEECKVFLQQPRPIRREEYICSS